MTTEEALCRNLVDVLKTDLGDVFADGNFLPPQGEAAKGDEPDYPAKLYVTVEPREYLAFTTRTAEFKATVEYSVASAHDPDMASILEAFASVTAILEGWQHDIAAAKAAITALDVAGVRVTGGGFDPNGDDRRRTFTKTATIRGRSIE